VQSPGKNLFPTLNNVRQNIKILVAPLDWGLGHATRCIPLIRALLEAGHEVLLAGEGRQASLLAAEFPSLTLLPLRGYRIRYSRKAWQLPFVLLAQLPGIRQSIRNEKKWLEQQVREHAIDLVISDNRYGLYHPRIPAVIITHQLTIITPLRPLQNLIRQIHYRLLNQFTQVWVPDAYEPPSVAGILSHPEKMPAIPVHYIGCMSRFEYKEVPITYQYCVVLSGPEPQRTLLEEKLLEGFKNTRDRVLFIRGLPGETKLPATDNHITCLNHLSGEQLHKAILGSEWIICRSGYTTVMEILQLRKKAILIPTPGQTEQIYLAKRLHELGWSFSVKQNKLELGATLLAAQEFKFSFLQPATFNKTLCLNAVQSLVHPDVALRQ
jgi:uncharacterized protein (TIGR00661 family)